jgi:hypothetical protein
LRPPEAEVIREHRHDREGADPVESGQVSPSDRRRRLANWID